eukprot:10015425-Alexandrium_andersonii.AAC.1
MLSSTLACLVCALPFQALRSEGTGWFSSTGVRYRVQWLQADTRELYGSKLGDHYVLAQAFEWGKRKLFASLTVHARAP